MEGPKRMHLFQGFGIELEYMIVDRDTLDVKPIADELIKLAKGEYADEYQNGMVTWSNELVLHVIELKCTRPERDLVKLNEAFHENIVQINDLLKKFNAKLMPTAAHPWMEPDKETFLWPHGNSDIYERYNKMFNCKGHGWSNLQSTHINFSFYDDEEFAKLHRAIRVVLPLIPALAASSPIIEQEATGFQSTRMDYYGKNQKRFPSITGRIIPEKVLSKRQYHKLIYDPITKDIEPFNGDDILDPVWVNSRGAIARFDRGSIEIRIMDIQECPEADLAIVSFIICLVKTYCNEQFGDAHAQHLMETDRLAEILQGSVKKGGESIIQNSQYLIALGLTGEQPTLKSALLQLLEAAIVHYPMEMHPWEVTLRLLINEGNLATRISKVNQGEQSLANLKLIYQELTENLSQNSIFLKNETVSHHSNL